jgi:hypothetical protein
MSTQTRAVSVRLDADIAGYLAKMSLAGAATDKAFDRAHTNLGQTNRGLADAAVSSVKLEQAVRGLDRSFDGLNTRSGYTVKQLDTMSGRVSLLVEAAAALGPALIPLGAATLPAITGLANGLGAVGTAAGVTLLAFHGLGDGLKALNAFQLDPTQDNLEKMREELDGFGPAGEHFVRYLDSLGPALSDLQDAAREGIFPGVEQGIDDLLTQLPQVQRIISSVADEIGALAEDTGASLAGGGFSAFFDYIETDAAPTLGSFARSLGNLTEGLANLLVAFAPLSRDFTTGLEEMTQSFSDWAAGVSQTQGFQDFVDYIRQSGPQAIDLLAAVGDALVQIAQATAPVGQVVLPTLTGLAQVLGAIADSPIGEPLFAAAAGLVALNRIAGPTRSAIGGLGDAFLDLRTSPDIAATAVQRFGRVAKVAAGAAGAGLFIASLSETSESLAALEGAAGGALAGFSVGGPWGAAIGGGIGLLVSLGQAHDNTAQRVDELSSAYDRQTGAITENTRVNAANDLQSQGLLDSATQLGIKTSTLTDYILGNADAQQKLNGALAGYDVDHTITSVDDLRASFSDAEIQTILNDRAATKLRDNLPGLATEWGLAGDQALELATAAKGSGDGLDASADAAARAAEKLQVTRSAARETAKGFITLGDSVNDSKTSLSEWLRDIEKQASALEHFGDNAVKAAHRGLDQGLIKSLEKAGPAGALRMRQLANATDAELKRANKAWQAGQDAIRDYVRAVGGVPPARLDVDNAEALAAIAQLNRELANIPREIRTNYYINTMRSITTQTMAGGRDGDPSTPYAVGGHVRGPGGPRDDLIPALLSNGEYVVQAAAVEKYGVDTLDAINARRLAYGGPVDDVLTLAAGGPTRSGRPVPFPRTLSEATA